MKNMVFLAALALVVSLFAIGCQNTGNKTVEIGVADGMPSGGEMPDMPGVQGEAPSGGSGEKPSGSKDEGKPQRPASATSASEGAGGKGGGVSVSENEVIGKVQSIAGNYVTLLIGESANGTITYGEEEKSYLLPVGMSIGTGDFSSVTVGMALKLSFEDGSDNITNVTIISR